jgi:hypothetical protein
VDLIDVVRSESSGVIGTQATVFEANTFDDNFIEVERCCGGCSCDFAKLDSVRWFWIEVLLCPRLRAWSGMIVTPE